MKNNFQTLTTDRLRKLISESEQTLTKLKAELEEREKISQNQEIANLEHHMQSAELSLKTIRDFLKFLSQELRDKKTNF